MSFTCTLNEVHSECSVPGIKAWSYMVSILEEKNGSDTELLVFTMTLINKVAHTPHLDLNQRSNLDCTQLQSTGLLYCLLDWF